MMIKIQQIRIMSPTHIHHKDFGVLEFLLRRISSKYRTGKFSSQNATGQKVVFVSTAGMSKDVFHNLNVNGRRISYN